MCWGSLALDDAKTNRVRVLFHNTGRRNISRAEAHLVYRTRSEDATRVTFQWQDDRGQRQASHVFHAAAREPWPISTGKNVQTEWVEFEPVAAE
jgi:hypothetical protein